MKINNINYLQSFFNDKKNSFNSNNISKENHEEKNATTSKIRLNKYDNLKGLAIILVVLGHIIPRFDGFPIYANIYNLIYIFHMPIFFFVAGYFSKVTENSDLKAFKSLMIPFFVFSILWYVFDYLLRGNVSDLPFILPPSGLWFLLALFFMKLFLPIFTKIKHMFWLSLILALLIGICDIPNNILAVSRFLCFTPVFLVGYYYKNSEKYLNNLKPKIKKAMIIVRDFIYNNKLILVIILIVSLIIIDIIGNYILPGRFTFRLSYMGLHQGIKYGMLKRLFVISAGIIITFLITLLMTDKKSFLTKIGRNSLAIYLLHFYLIVFSNMFITKTHIGHLISHNVVFSGIYLVVATMIIVIILSPNIFNDSIRKLNDYVWDIFFKIPIK
ncbi:acyltransferase family protein [Methanobrevibacter sp. TMH8]|uniref:acyltransferase family protein n=1 Tax=Methanobrevibacter sp. TMH8 TaxID=2848611 RepID=UPI001CCC9842|nr:acyltransferase family protein [Methanobrevibacter sp. TMH8]MBZ9570432.1 acyltransferase family protein [Methanobrevibacter sp. TMH8]